MTLVALANALLGDRMVERFHAEPRVQATELLLQERVPRDVATIEPRPLDEMRVAAPVASVPVRRYRSPHTLFPHTQFLSNGNYVTSVTNAGGGASVWRGLPVTRWRRDATRDADGQFIYLRDVRSGAVWSATYQPTRREPDEYARDVLGRSGHLPAPRRRHRRRSSTSRSPPKTTSRCGGSPSATTGTRIREIDVTSYAEIVLAPAVSDLAHPAFGKLFVETEYLADSSALLCHRRPRDPRRGRGMGVPRAEPRGPAAGAGRMGDRSRALPRPRAEPRRSAGARRTRALGHDGRRARSDRQPAPADPALARRRRCGSRSPPASPPIARRPRRSRGSTTTPSAAGAHLRARHARTRRAACATSASRQTRPCCSSASRRGCSAPTARSARTPRRSRPNELGQSGLWPHAISGDLPILLVRVVGDDDVPLVRQVLQAQEYWRLKGLSADVVILNEHPVSYLDEMQAQLTAVLDDGPWSTWQHRPGGAYLLRADRMGRAERVLLEAVARAILRGDRGDLRTQLDRPGAMPPPATLLVATAPSPRRHAGRGWSPAGAGDAATGSAASPTAHGPTPSSSTAPAKRRCRGRTSSPTRSSAPSSRRRVRRTRGRRTAARTG